MVCTNRNSGTTVSLKIIWLDVYIFSYEEGRSTFDLFSNKVSQDDPIRPVTPFTHVLSRIQDVSQATMSNASGWSH